jgi:hypothetical protein
MASTAEKLEDPTPPAPHPRWRARLSSWWHGSEPGPDGGDGGDDAARDPDSGDGAGVAAAAPERSPARLHLIQRLWGAGFAGPGGGDHLLDLVKPLDLSDGKTLLIFGGGLGGPARLLTESCGVRVEAWDPDPAIAAAHDAAVDSEIRSYSPDALEAVGAPVECRFSKEAIFALADKEAFFDALTARLSQSGELVFTDYVIAEGAAEAPEIRAWLTAEAFPRHPVTLEAHRAALEARGLSIRSSEPITETHRHLILRGLESFMDGLRRDPLERALLAELPGELEIWSRRVQAIEAGALDVCRLHAGR